VLRLSSGRQSLVVDWCSQAPAKVAGRSRDVTGLRGPASQASPRMRLGRGDEADQALAVLERKVAVGGAYNIAEIYALRNEADPAFAWLDRAYRQRDSGLPLVKVDALLKNLQADARYQALLLKMKLQ
jgi:hypothetical protein